MSPFYICTPQITQDCYYTCTYSDILTALTVQQITFDVSQITQIASNFLSVNQTQGNLLLSNSSCGNVSIPIQYLTDGVVADLVLFVTARPVLSGNVLAFASACQIDFNTNRPIAGVINFSPASYFNVTERMRIGVALHELTHILGFNSDFFSTLNATVNGSVRNGTPVRYILTPNVLQYVREFFNCPTLVGAELENQGGNGTQWNHWEKRLFQEEYMTGTLSPNPIFSNLTLALLSDFGFYVVDNSAPIVALETKNPFGEGLGCSFAIDTCNTWKDPLLSICSSSQQTGCSYEGSAKGVCTFQTYSTLIPNYFRYFLNPQQGGLELPDFCPMIEGVPDGDCRVSTNSLANSGDRLEEYGGLRSKCILASITSPTSPLFISSPIPGCYTTACVSNVNLMVKIGKFYYNCTKENDIIIPLVGANGLFLCPRIQYYCTDPYANPNWPTFSSASPSQGREGTQFTIYGSNFVFGMQVFVGEGSHSSFQPPFLFLLVLKTSSM